VFLLELPTLSLLVAVGHHPQMEAIVCFQLLLLLVAVLVELLVLVKVVAVVAALVVLVAQSLGLLVRQGKDLMAVQEQLMSTLTVHSVVVAVLVQTVQTVDLTNFKPMVALG
jgi:hypothetical protein